jgi:hypothetical protein
MCLSWILYLTEARRTAWGIPEAECTEPGSLSSTARALLQKARNDAERTQVLTVECPEAFKALSSKIRFFRDRYFKMPPLSEGDRAALGFRQKDTGPSPAVNAQHGCAEGWQFTGRGRILRRKRRLIIGNRDNYCSPVAHAVFCGQPPIARLKGDKAKIPVAEA